MKKTVMAGLVASMGLGLTGGALAQSAASVQLYGLMDAFVANERTSAGSALRVDSGGMTTSFWGMRGSEDLGGGLKAIFALEAFISNDTGNAGRFPGDPAFARSAFVGVEAGWGKLTLGRNTTPYFVSTLLANPFGDSFAFSPEILRTYAGRGYLIGDTGWSNSVAYSGTAGGVGINAIYTFGDEVIGNTSSGKGFGLSANYFAGPLMVSGAYQSKNSTAASPQKQDSFRLGASYDLGPAKLFGSFQTTKDRDGLVVAGLTNADHNGYQIGVSAPAGGGSVLASYGRTKSSGTGGLSGARGVFAIGYDYNLSKRTDVYAAFYSDSGDKSFPAASWQGKIERLGFGIRHRF
jgi:predicted porin